MIKKIELENFKKFQNKSVSFFPDGVSILVGGNNMGKSSLLHALAVWEFCKTFLLFEKGRRALNGSYSGQGVGTSLNDFSPINLPDLKYLWTNLKSSPGYTLKIKGYWDLPGKPDRFLEIGLALNQARLFIKKTSSNLVLEDKVPTLAYLPPFAGISSNETWQSNADRRRAIGSGLAGSVLRNLLMEMFQRSVESRKKMQGTSNRLRGSRLEDFLSNDPFQILNTALFETFQANLFPSNFNPNFHNYIKIDVAKGKMTGRRFIKHPGYNKRDIMVEGSGFLQWLSVFAFALDKGIDVLLLDEPDAHLHCSLQETLLEKLVEIAQTSEKQVLMATHSIQIVGSFDYRRIIHIKKSSLRYLPQESSKVGVIANLGADYSPKLAKIQRHKNVLFVENDSDHRILQKFASTLGKPWPENLVSFPFANKHSQRKDLVLQLKDDIDSHPRYLASLSLGDRDFRPISRISEDLSDGENGDLALSVQGGQTHIYLRCRTWRRRYIENYILSVPAIARKAGTSFDEMKTYFQDNFGLVWPGDDWKSSEVQSRTESFFTCTAKDIFANLESDYRFDKFSVVAEMNADEIPNDIITLIDEIILMCQN